MKTLLWVGLILAGTAGVALAAEGLSLERRNVVSALVNQLGSQDPEARDGARIALLSSENRPFLKPFSQEIIRSLAGDLKSERSVTLLARLDLPEDLVQAIRTAPLTPDYVKARLGDQEAERRVVQKFEASKDLFQLRRSAEDLIYCNGKVSWQAFFAGLQSKEVFVDPHGNEVSRVVMLLQCYGREFPEEPLFRAATYTRHANVSREQFQERKHQEYLRAVEAHFAKKYGAKVRINPPLLLNDQARGVHIEKIK